MPLPSKDSMALLEKMLATPSPSGFEARLQAVIRDHCSQYADEVQRDVHGNQWFVVNPKGKVRLMLSGHVDEIGLMVRYVDAEGFLWVTRIGGPDPLQHWGQRVHVHTKNGPVLGVIGRKPIHNTPPEERTKGAKLEDLYVDIGAKDKEEALKRVRLGDPITMAVGFERMPNDLAIARAMDDRIGAFVVLEAMRKFSLYTRKKKGAGLDCALYAVCSVQEEVGLRGAQTSAYAIDPHVGIAVDVGFATDYPSENKKILGEFKLGEGPILHRGANINPPLAEMMEGLADKHNIPYQISGDGGIMGTDAGAIQVNKRGVAAALVSIPNRYMHSPVEMISLKDVENSSELLAQVAIHLKAEQSFIPEAKMLKDEE
ncbi:MAG TPA: M42 family metallopeptidase [Planctomycetota bacterium]|nr:M42 family metallopeptidase [Planctomycetota bacterium]